MPTVNQDVNVNVEVEVEVYCSRCGAGLCNNSKGGNTRNRNQTYIEVEPCEKCLQKEREESRERGYEEGYERGTDEGYERGRLFGAEGEKQK